MNILQYIALLVRRGGLRIRGRDHSWNGELRRAGISWDGGWQNSSHARGGAANLPVGLVPEREDPIHIERLRRPDDAPS